VKPTRFVQPVNQPELPAMNTPMLTNIPEASAIAFTTATLCPCGLCGLPLQLTPQSAAASAAAAPQSAITSVTSLLRPLDPPAPPTTVIAKVISGDPRIDSLIDGPNFRFNDGSPVATPVTVTYSFPAVLPGTYVGDNAKGWQPFSNEQKAAVRDILSLLQSQVNVTFQEVGEGTMRFSNNVQTASAGYAFFPNANGVDLDSDTWLKIDPENTGLARGTYGWTTLVHEIGHAIGLNHPGNYNAGEPSRGAEVGNFLGVNEDTFFNSIMSYRQSAQGINDTWFMPYDLLTLRYLYGTKAFAAENNTYRFTDASGLQVDNIVDDGGIDTLDFSALTIPAEVNLTPGAYSSVGKIASGANALANLTVSLDATIEHAIGSPQADTFVGNAANNVFTGGAGDDSINGGAGGDTAVFSGPRASYTVTRGASNIVVTSNGGPDGTDTLANVERVQFSDVKVAYDTALGQSAGNAVLLLGAVLGPALLAAKKPLINTVAELFDTGIYSTQILAGAVLRLPIWGLLANGGAATATNTQIASYLLTTVNQTAPDAATLAAAVNALNTETGTAQGTFLGLLAESAANQLNVGLVGLATTGLDLGPPAL
jgi:serralysin